MLEAVSEAALVAVSAAVAGCEQMREWAVGHRNLVRMLHAERAAQYSHAEQAARDSADSAVVHIPEALLGFDGARTPRGRS